MRLTRTSIAPLLLAALLHAPAPARAAEKWTLKGKLVVAHVLPELTQLLGSAKGPVAGVTVKVSARSRVLGEWGTWNSWGKAVTRADGSFSFTEDHGGDRRQFKVEVLFDDDRLRIKEGQETSVKLDSTGFPIDVDLDLSDKDWHEVWNDKTAAPSGRQAGLIDLGEVAMPAGVVQKHADLWTLYGMTLDLFQGYGADYAFQKKVTVKYPMGIGNNDEEFVSYSNPFNGNVYIKGDEFIAQIMLHELLHQWSYQRSRGEDAMAWQLAKHKDTHQLRENTTAVPFQESFADWASYRVLQELSGGKVLNFSAHVTYKFPTIPLNRAYLASVVGTGGGTVTLANVDFTEDGWFSLYNVLTHPFLDRCDFNRELSDGDGKIYAFVALVAKSCPERRTGYSFKDVLSVFLKHPAKGIETYLSRSEQDFEHFLGRAGAILPGLEKAKIQDVKTYLDPSKTDNPCP